MRLSNKEVLLRWPLEIHQLTAGNYYRGSDGEYKTWHGAIDLRCTYGGTTAQPVYAAEPGTVDWVQAWDGHTKTGNQSYGNCVRICHAAYAGKKLQTLYAHLSKICVKSGQAVSEGQVIGYTGNTGNSGGAHLHFEVRWGSVRKNPLCWLDSDYTAASGYTPYTYGHGERPVVREQPGTKLYSLLVRGASAGDADALKAQAEQLGLAASVTEETA